MQHAKQEEQVHNTTSISFPNMYAPGDIFSGDKSWEKEPLFRTEATDSWQSHQATMKKAYLVWLHFPSNHSVKCYTCLFQIMLWVYFVTFGDKPWEKKPLSNNEKGLMALHDRAAISRFWFHFPSKHSVKLILLEM